jgi:hypothetical protein
MAYNTQLHIPTKSLNLLNQFAISHGCTYKIIKSKSSKQLIQFSSDNFHHLEELIQQTLGFIPTQQKLKTLIWES